MSTDSAIKLLIVDDSLVFCKFLTINLPRLNPNIQIVGTANSAEEAFKMIPVLKPDVITLDIEMPKMNGIEFLKKLIPEYPIPVILSSSLNVNVFDALSYGAVDFVKKPDMTEQNSATAYVYNIVAKIVAASKAHVRKPAVSAVKPANTPPQSINLGALKLSDPSNLKLKNTIIAIGASTGGTEATLEVLKKLPAETPGIVVTQHMPEGFTKMYADRLNKLCAMEVKEAENGDLIRQGRVLIAPGGDNHMTIERRGSQYFAKLTPGEKVNGHRPSVDVLFNSVAKEAVRGSSVGIILTGMGNDGAKGLLEMRKARAFTIGQDKNSCVVYGMPMEAYKLGAVCKQAPCCNIAGILVNYLNSVTQQP